MAENPCIEAARQVGGEDLTDKQLEDILTILDAKAARAMREEPGLGEGAAYQRAAGELQAERRLEVLIAKRQRAMNVAAKLNREKRYATWDSEKMPIHKQPLAVSVGVEGVFSHAGLSVDAQMHGLEAELVGPMLAELDEAGLMEAAKLKNPDFESNVAHEMARLNGDDSIKPTQDKHAAQMAEIFVRHTERSRHMQNGAGAFIRKMKGYITRQMHDQITIYRAGKDAWIQATLPLLDERTFDGVKDVQSYMAQVWTNLASGDHEKAAGGSSWLGGFEGPGNLAKRASSERSLHFKDPASWLAYNNQFGRKSLFESVLSGLQYSARNTAVMRVWGTNPEAAFIADIKQLKARAKAKGDIAGVNDLRNPNIRWAFDEVTGGTRISGNPTLAMWGGTVRTLINASTLGGVVLSSLPDIATRASVLMHNGVPLTKQWGEAADAALHGLQLSGDRAKAAKILNVGVQGMIGGVFHRFSATDSAHGAINKFGNAFFKYTLLTGWTDGWTRWAGITLANHMGDLAHEGRVFADLDPRHQTTLRRYGIGTAEWDALSKAEVFDADGSKLMMPDHVKEIPDTVAAEYLKTTGVSKTPSATEIARTKQDLSLKLSSYYASQVREAMTIGGAKEKSLLSFGLPAGTVAGEAMRFIMQFKQFPVTFVTKHLNREFNRAGAMDKGGVGYLLAGTTAMGFLSLYFGALAKGQKLKEPEDAAGVASLIAESMAKGGSAGIYGDMLYGAMGGGANRVAANVLGPGYGKLVGPVADIVMSAARGEDPSAKALKAGIGLVPYNNLFYARLGLDYMLLNGLQETMNPGYLRRYERMMERDYDRSWWLPPTSSMNQ